MAEARVISQAIQWDRSVWPISKEHLQKALDTTIRLLDSEDKRVAVRAVRNLISMVSQNLIDKSTIAGRISHEHEYRFLDPIAEIEKHAEAIQARRLASGFNGCNGKPADPEPPRASDN
jgi:hypothetical protein